MNPESILSAVVLPAPFLPTSPKTPPEGMVSEKSVSNGLPPIRLFTCSKQTATGFECESSSGTMPMFDTLVTPEFASEAQPATPLLVHLHCRRIRAVG